MLDVTRHCRASSALARTVCGVFPGRRYGNALRSTEALAEVVATIVDRSSVCTWVPP
jgi:hypothetical protein